MSLVPPKGSPTTDPLRQAGASPPPGGGKLPDVVRVAAALLARALRATGRRPPPVLIPPAGCVSETARGGKHTEDRSTVRPLAELWANEGEDPVFTEPHQLIDLQIWHRGELHTLAGERASRYLSVLAPTVFCEDIGGRRGAVAQAYIHDRLGYRLTGSTLARSYAGATGQQPRDVLAMADSMLKPKWRPHGVTGKSKNQRFFNCVSSVFLYFKLLGERRSNSAFFRLGQLLTRDMIRRGRCRSELVETYLNSVEIILHGHKARQHELHEFILSLPPEERGDLWRSRRLFAKDDNDPLVNAIQAINRMVVPTTRTTEQEALALRVIDNFQRRAAEFVAANLEKLRDHHDHASMHRASATTFFSRGAGGGAAELHTTVALHRLSQGKATTLQDVWGVIPEHLSMGDLLGTVHGSGEIREEIIAACDWMLDELARRKVSYPYLCIYPEREVKSRSFMLLPYAVQLGGYFAATVVSQYLRTRENTREVFRGFDDTGLLRRIRRDIEQGMTHALSLDSQVSTDPLPHDLCRKVYAPFYPAFSSYTIKAVERVFSPTRVHAARSRPKDFLNYLTFSEHLMHPLAVRILGVTPPPRGEVLHFTTRLRVHPHDTPKTLRTWVQAPAITQALKRFGRVILKAPTGSGKTVLVSTLFNAIVQFPSIQALELMSEYLTAMGKPHNVCHSRRKTEPLEWDTVANEPYTILCTAFYVRGISQSYPRMVIALDEAETKQENYVINLEATRHLKRPTLLMSATPDELTGEDSTTRVELEGGTNFPVSEHRCTYQQMMGWLLMEGHPPALVCAPSEPLCEKIANAVLGSGRSAFALTARQRGKEDYLEKIKSVDVIVSTNAIRSSVTLPDLEVVYDLGRIYESIDFPLSGMESLVLCDVSKAMRLQCRGRVGRLKPGRYYEVVDPPGSAIPYTSDFLARVPVIARQSDRIALSCYSRRVNAGSIIVERFAQQLAGCAGVKLETSCPSWASIVRQLAPVQTARLLATVGFEAMGIVNRTRQLSTDLDMREPYEQFNKLSITSYHVAVRRLLRRLQAEGWFPSEIAQLTRWTESLPSDEEGDIWCRANQQATSVALWRQVSQRHGRVLSGKYRNFSVPLPPGSAIEEGQYCLTLGLSLHNAQVTARWALPLDPEVIVWLDELCAQVKEVRVVEDALGGGVPAILGWDAELHNKGRQTRKLALSYDAYTRGHVYQPESLERIWAAMLKSIDDVRDGEVAVTTQGSPMSATASFPVLNSFGLAAHDAVEDGVVEGVLCRAKAKGIFGDDDFRLGTADAIAAGTACREALGLQTKLSATGLAEIARGGRLLGCEDQLGVYTERIIDFKTLRIVPSVKPAGLLRLYMSQHPDAAPFHTASHRADMLHYEQQLARVDPRWKGVVSSTVQHPMLHARRETAPRRILSRMFRSRATLGDRVATGEVSRLFEHLELLLLQVCPSTKGEPDRVLDPSEDPLGHPIVSYRDARMLERFLQGDDCYFKLRGPPISLRPGPQTHVVATRIAQSKGLLGPVPDADDVTRFMRATGWGVNSSDVETQEPDDEELAPLAPIDDGDLWD